MPMNNSNGISNQNQSIFKRRITVEQFNELTSYQKQKLRDWWNPHEGDFIISQKDNRIKVISNINKGFADEYYLGADINYSTDIVRLDICFPLLDIAQMFELLNGTVIEITRNGLNNPFIFNGVKHDNLCDALWKVVKEVL